LLKKIICTITIICSFFYSFVLLFLLDVSFGSLARPQLIILMIAEVASLASGKKIEVSFGGGHNRLVFGFCIAIECVES
jgi:hypothetical protein